MTCVFDSTVCLLSTHSRSVLADIFASRLWYIYSYDCHLYYTIYYYMIDIAIIVVVGCSRI